MTALWACLCVTGVTVGLIIAINVVWKGGQVDHCKGAILGPLGLIIAKGQLGGLCGLIIANVILIIADPDHCMFGLPKNANNRQSYWLVGEAGFFLTW